MVVVKTLLEKTNTSLAFIPAIVLLGIGLVSALGAGWLDGLAPGWTLVLGVLAVVPAAFSVRAQRGAQRAWREALMELAGGNDAAAPSAKLRQDSAMTAVFDALAGRLAEMQARQQHAVAEIAAIGTNLGMIRDTVSQCGNDSGQHEASVAIDELVQAVEEIANNASSAAQSTHQASQESDKGKVTMTDALGSMASMTSQLERSTQTVEQLSKETQNIGAVLDVIRGIAEQTNLLALNAAIEAARAGEQGRGFAVVADEVRHLASRTQQSTQEIHEMIEKLQNKANDAVQVMAEGNQQVSVVEEMLENATMSLAEIGGYIQTIDGMNTTVASAAEQQSVAVQSIREVVHGNRSKTESAAEIVAELQQIMDQVEQLRGEAV